MKQSTGTTGQVSVHRALVPPIWLVMLFTILGIYAMNLVYKAVVDGAWRGGLVGAVLLAITVYVTGTPLAASMWSHRSKKATRRGKQKP